MLALDSILANRYRIRYEIGQGGMAVIYVAEDMRTGEDVAIKVLRSQYAGDAEFVRRFEREAYAMLRVQHPNIVQVYDVGHQDGVHYIVMEFVKGQTLKEYIQNQGALSVEEATRICLALCAALQTAHDNGVIHRDVKPHNVLISENGDVKMTDFGIAKVEGASTTTLSGENVLGSVHYIAPEQAQGQPTDEKTDIYSLGISMYEMLTGQLPFQGDTTVNIALQHVQERMPSPCEVDASIPYSLGACVRKACAKDPAQRYQTPRDMANDLVLTYTEPDGHFADLSEDREQTAVIPAVREERRTAKNKSPKRNIMKIFLPTLGAVLILVTLFFIVNAVINNAGGELVAVPSVVGSNSAQAQATLVSANLQVTLEYTFDDQVPEDQVIRQSVEEGELVKQKTNVTITISKGVEQIPVPDLKGLTQEQAIGTLQEVGLKVGQVWTVYEPNEAPGLVVRQNPSYDTDVPRGDEVDIYIATDQAPNTVPQGWIE